MNVKDVANHCSTVLCNKPCDTCDSKKAKTLVVCVRACARESQIIGIFTIYIVVLHLLFYEGYFYSKSFNKNKPMFYEKRAVVL